MKVFYDKDCDLSILINKNISIIGFGSQGQAHAQNLQDSGINVTVGLRKNSNSYSKVMNAGLKVQSIPNSVSDADIVMLLIPDEVQKQVYNQEIEPHLKKGSSLAFAHGFNIHFKQIKPRSDLDVIMIAPKGPGHTVRSSYVNGLGVPSLIAIYQDISGFSRKIAMAYASANGAGRSGIIETSFREETETDLFGEQTVLCGGITALIKTAFDTLINSGYSEEMAYLECLYELKLIVDLLHKGGINNMHNSISNTAKYGGIISESRIVSNSTKKEMKNILTEIQNGTFAKQFLSDNNSEKYHSLKKKHITKNRTIDQVGKRLRSILSLD